MKVEIPLDGDTVRALLWESKQRQKKLEELISILLEPVSAELVARWRKAHEGVYIMWPRMEARHFPSVEAVVKQAHGPSRRRTLKPALSRS